MQITLKTILFALAVGACIACHDKEPAKFLNGSMQVMRLDSLDACKDTSIKYFRISIEHSFGEPGLEIEYKNGRTADSLYVHTLTVTSDEKFQWYRIDRTEAITAYNHDEIMNIRNQATNYTQDSTNLLQEDGDEWSILNCGGLNGNANKIQFGNMDKEAVNANNLQIAIINFLRHSSFKDDSILHVVNQHIRKYSAASR